MDSLLIDISDLAGSPGAVKDIRFHGAITGLRGGLAWVEEDEPVDVAVTAEVLVDGIEVGGKVAGTLHLNCSRCLKEFEEKFETSVRETYYYEQGEERGGYQVEGSVIDLEAMLRDVVVLDIPIRPLHKQDCKGLCTACGADLNSEDCGHDQEMIDIRWAPLKDLLEASQEGEEA